MSNRRANNRNATNNRIRGPQSALTDFLASNNIDANQIRLDYEARRRAAEQQVQQDAQTNSDQAASAADEQAARETLAEAKKRKRQSQKAIDKIKASKKFQRSRQNKGDGDDDLDDEAAAWNMYEKSKALPGQLENCVKCHKRFTVTAYSKAGPLGGLLCPACSKEVEKEDKKAKPKKKPLVRRDRNRQLRSDMLDGVVQRGSKRLLELCIQRIANSIDDVEDFGELPANLREALCRILSKKRAMNSRTLDLFLNPEYNKVTIYDAAALSTADFEKIFAVMPGIQDVVLDNAGQFKSEVLQYVTGHPSIQLAKLHLAAANLIENEVWKMFFIVKGQSLQTIQLGYIDGHFGDDTFAQLVQSCPNLKRLKLEHVDLLTSESVEKCANLKRLEHLSLQLTNSIVEDSSVILVLEPIGRQLRTLCLMGFGEIGTDTMAAIHEHCRNLSKLRITKNTNLVDSDFVGLFTGWANPPLSHIDFGECRHLDAAEPHKNPDGVGLCGDGFEALMQHSGAKLEHLCVTACRHITHAAFSSVFDGQKVYAALAYICVSFCGAVDDAVVAGMFRSCPRLRKVQVFGCFGVKDVVVPRGVVLLGRPNAQDELAIEGEADDVV